MSSKLERDFQHDLILEIKRRLPGALVQKNKSSYQQGIPDLMVLWKDRWAALEVKKSEDAPFQPNQEWFIDQMNQMSFSSAIFPENREEVLDALESALRSPR